MQTTQAVVRDSLWAPNTNDLLASIQHSEINGNEISSLSAKYGSENLLQSFPDTTGTSTKSTLCRREVRIFRNLGRVKFPDLWRRNNLASNSWLEVRKIWSPGKMNGGPENPACQFPDLRTEIFPFPEHRSRNSASFLSSVTYGASQTPAGHR